MARKAKTTVIAGQGDLIDVQPENAKAIAKAARAYKIIQAERSAILTKEVDQKKKILALVKEGGVRPLPDGTIRLLVDGITVIIKPRDELVRVLEGADET
jgi:hypothetical protein